MKAGAPETVLYSKHGPVAHIVLNRPESINAFDFRMRDELSEVMEAVRDDPEVRVAVLRGAGERGFCAGADLREFGTAPSTAIARQARWQRDIWGQLLGLEKPLIAALHGQVLGSGVEIACLCDIRIASEDAVFGMPEVALGMIPAAGGTQTVPRMTGTGRALEMLLTNRRVTALEALRLGLVHRLVPKEVLVKKVQRIALELACRPPGVITAVKTAILMGMDLPLDKGLGLESRLMAQLANGLGGGLTTATPR